MARCYLAGACMHVASKGIKPLLAATEPVAVRVRPCYKGGKEREKKNK